jgi:hypothetical protein
MTGLNIYIKKIVRRIDNLTYGWRQRYLSRANKSKEARIGIYVAYYDASWVFEDHLRCISSMTKGSFNYYVMGNCTTPLEEKKFLDAVGRHSFVKPFSPWLNLMPFGHGQSLQRLIDRTTDDIIVLCDVDAFPVRHGWDDFIVNELAKKDIVAVVVDMPHRIMPVFLHPCFMAFRRKLLIDNKLNLLPSGENDPACMITTYLLNSGRMTPDHVTPLYPTRRELQLSLPGTNDFFGRNDLVHGFGTTYADLVFHFWFARHVAKQKGVIDAQTNISEAEVRDIVAKVFSRVRLMQQPIYEKSAVG